MAPFPALFLFISILSLHYCHIFFRGVVQYRGCLLCMVVMGRKLPAEALGKICSDCFLYLDWISWAGPREWRPSRIETGALLRPAHLPLSYAEILAELRRSQTGQYRTLQTELRRAQKCLLVLQLQLEWVLLHVQ
jgi:hypothetical protein